MAHIFDSLKSLLKPELAKAAVALGEPAEKISAAASGMLPGILSKIMHKGASAPVDAAIEEAGKNDILSHLGSIFSGKATSAQAAPGNKLLHSLLGDHADDFMSAWAKDAGIGKGNAAKLAAMIGTAVVGFLGHSKLKGSALVDALGREKEGFLSAIPERMKDIPLSMPHHRAHASQKGSAHATQPGGKKKCGLCWLWWLLGLLLLALLILLCCRSCKDKKVEPVVEAPVAVAPTPSRTVDLTLPNGVKLNVPRNGMEQKMVDFLNSNAYKNGTDADLRNHWFEFEDVDFVRDSASEFMNKATSEARLINVATILKAFPEANIRIGGNADKSGHTAYNLEISRERAIFIDMFLDNHGLDAHRISTEGFGDEKAVFPATASAEQAAPDRDIAFRFTKK